MASESKGEPTNRRSIGRKRNADAYLNDSAPFSSTATGVNKVVTRVNLGASAPFAAPQTFTLTLYKYEKMVSMRYPLLSSTADGSTRITLTHGTIPAEFLPPATIVIPVTVIDNGADVYGNVIIYTSGQVIWSVGAGSTNFTASGAAGVQGTCVNWITS